VREQSEARWVDFVNTPEFKRSVALYDVFALNAYAFEYQYVGIYLALAARADPTGVAQVEFERHRQQFQERVRQVRLNPTRAESLALHGVSNLDLLRLEQSSLSDFTLIAEIDTKVASYVAAEGSAAARAFFAEAQAAAAAAKQRAEQQWAGATPSSKAPPPKPKAPPSPGEVAGAVQDAVDTGKDAADRLAAEAKRKAEEDARKLVDETKRAAADAARYTGQEVVKPAADQAADAARWTGKNVVNPAADAAADAARWTGREVVKPAADAVGDAARWTGENVVNPAADAAADAKRETEARRTETAGDSGQRTPETQRQVLHTWDGSVELSAGANRVAVGRDQTIAVAGPGGAPVFLPDRSSGILDSNAPRPDRVKVNPELFGGDGKTVEAGLYVWVREGAVSLGRDGTTVDVPSGNAAVATRDRIEMLDAVPSFMRFDGTPRPTRALGEPAVEVFRAPDGSIQNLCVVR
jgi:hypothetical protein